MTDLPPPARPYWTRARAVAQLRRLCDAAPAGPERVQAGLALTWLDEHCAELERERRDAEVTRELPP